MAYCQEHINFYPRSPCGERPILKVYGYGENKFLSTLSLRRATRPPDHPGCHERISIHALLAESDFSCHSVIAAFRHFYPRSPCGERPVVVTVVFYRRPISIHALLAESDLLCFVFLGSVEVFLSTLSLRRATWRFSQTLPTYPISIHALLAESDGRFAQGNEENYISIHALLAESDMAFCVDYLKSTYFYPRSPCGERPRGEHHASSQKEFLSTLSLRRATK